jgi:predicted DsbA family dithiol-disulfide isomerase
LKLISSKEKTERTHDVLIQLAGQVGLDTAQAQ